MWLPLGWPGRVAQSVGHLTRKLEVLGSIPGLATYFRFSSAFSRRAVVSYWRKYVHEVLVNRLGGLSLPRKSVVRLTDRPDMTLNVYRGRKTTMQQQQQQSLWGAPVHIHRNTFKYARTKIPAVWFTYSEILMQMQNVLPKTDSQLT